ncbi:MAG TPA: alpha/beta hydrolase [Candidatus Saccharimonadales bacterium]|nr:alpha/beta hydrolase [Candidatus Saccharimonadales bacterium]
MQLDSRVHFSGSAPYRAKSALLLCRTIADVALRRLRNGPLCPEWNFAAELATEISRKQLLAAFAMPDIKQARTYLDSIAVYSSALSKVGIAEISLDKFKGTWITPPNPAPNQTILFLHGGGYAFYPRNYYNNLCAMIALSARTRMFALDYRLAPEHRFPAQLADATNAYFWLLETGVNPRELVVIGDSAGGNLALSLLLSLRDSKLPLPALAICLSPATDFEGKGLGAPPSSEIDWITQHMAMKWADWFCPQKQRCDPRVSPLNADLQGLPPIYIQAGGAEILLPSIQLFAERAREQKADVILETWPSMNHDFQAFGYDVPQSAEAIRRIGAVIASHIP